MTRCNLPIRTGKLVRLTTRSSTTFGCHSPAALAACRKCYFAAALPERKTLGRPQAGPLDEILDLFFSLGAELNIAIIDGTSRRFIGGW